MYVLQLMRAVVMKQKSVLALWHWSQSLQRKVCIRFFVCINKFTASVHILYVHSPGSGVLADVCDDTQAKGRGVCSSHEEIPQSTAAHRSDTMDRGTDVDLHTLCVLVYV